MSKLVKADHVFLDVPVTTRDEVLQFLSDKAAELGAADDAEAVLAAFEKRESEGATGLQGGFAIPHAQADVVKKGTVLVVKPQSPVEWETMDGKPVSVAIALLCPTGEAGKGHLKMLSHLAVLLMQPKFCDTLLGAEDAEAIAEAIDEGLDAE